MVGDFGCRTLFPFDDGDWIRGLGNCSAGLRRFVAKTRGFGHVSKLPQVPAKDAWPCATSARAPFRA